MKRKSIKLKITLWLTLLMALLSGLMLIFMLTVSRSVLMRTATGQLTQVVRENASHVTLFDGKLHFDDNFEFYQTGISTLVYNKREALLAGQVPVSFTENKPFQSGIIRTVDAGKTQYLLLDIWVACGWDDDGLWVRGLMEAPENSLTTYNLLGVALITLPLFILLAAVGGYLILRRSFRQLDTINDTASAIGETRDLSRRIGLPPGRDEFSRLAETFDKLFARLERSFEAEKQFTADASHELRTPVSIIKGACEYAQKYDETPEERAETLEMIHRQTLKMSAMIDQLLNMTRLEQGTELPGMKGVDLADVVKDALGSYSSDALHAELQPDVMVWGDEELLSRLTQNLVDNAFKYGRPGGNVWVKVIEEADEALLCVRDDGVGIMPEHRDRIWQRFYQTDPARGGENSGAGLGLAIVEQIAHLHGGYMTLESLPEVGSVFTLHLPILESGEDKNF